MKEKNSEESSDSGTSLFFISSTFLPRSTQFLVVAKFLAALAALYLTLVTHSLTH